MLKHPKSGPPAKITAPKKAAAKKEETPKEDPNLTKAKELVEGFTKKLAEYDEQRAEFEATYPEPAQVLRQLDARRSELATLVELVKAAVREAKQSVGDFHLTIPRMEQGYRGEKVMKTLVELIKESETEGHVENYEPICLLLKRLYDAGAATEIKFDKKAGQVFHSRYAADEDVKLIEEGWSEGGEELAAQCKAPKV